RYENEQLREELDGIERRAIEGKQAKVRLMRGGLRLLIPLLDRQKVARNFGKLVETIGDFSGPRAGWPSREKILADAKEFLESSARFVIRRRLFVLLFTLLASAIPAIQIYLVFQQNEIIENQNDLFEIQVYDVVASSMTEGDRNARLMTGALLANADLAFLRGVVDEAFDPSLSGVYRAEGVHAARRRLEDAAFRGHLIRAAARGVAGRAESVDTDTLFEQARPMFQRIVADAADRLPQVIRLGQTEGIDDGLSEQVDHYVSQLGAALRVYARLSRSAGQEELFYRDIRLLLVRMAGRRSLGEGRFVEVYRAVMQDFLFEVAEGSELGAPPPDLEGVEPSEALRRGLATLREGVGEDALDWARFALQVGAR
ncbi:MAG: hypothetical protein OEY14_15720, partial [Myxococcales bacterium]|nr:hypothetical protein [Myxococcales bacterium]